MKLGKQKALYRISLGIFLCASLLVTLRGLRRQFLPLPEDRCTRARFDPVAWRDSSLAFSERAVRGCMVDDLLARYPLVGRSRADVVALLGEPSRTRYFANYDMVYWLGPEGGLISIDSEWLVLRLDKTGRVTFRGLATD